LTSAKNHQVSEALEQVVLTIIVSTGLVSVLVINDYNSCLAHSIYYGCTMLPQGEKHLHGELVSYGVLVMLLLDKQQTEFEKVYAFNRQAKLPTCLKDIEISTKEELDIVLDKVMTTNDIVHVPYKITREMVYDAIMDLEIYHQEHLN
jgi:glycerol dehydrogenase-like iron-containing ADH family enzyme